GSRKFNESIEQQKAFSQPAYVRYPNRDGPAENRRRHSRDDDREIGGIGSGSACRRHWLSIGFARNTKFRNGRGIRPEISWSLFFDHALASESTNPARRGGRAAP